MGSAATGCWITLAFGRPCKIQRSLPLNLDDISGSAPRHHSANSRRGLAQWIVGKVGIPLSRLHLSVTKQRADQRKRGPTADEDARKSMPQVMYADAL